MKTNIPPKGSIPSSIKKKATVVEAIEKRYQVKRYMPEFKRMRIGTLERMLVDAQSLESEMLCVMGLDASDENLARLDKLQYTIHQLKVQIAGKKK